MVEMESITATRQPNTYYEDDGGEGSFVLLFRFMASVILPMWRFLTDNQSAMIISSFFFVLIRQFASHSTNTTQQHSSHGLFAYPDLSVQISALERDNPGVPFAQIIGVPALFGTQLTSQIFSAVVHVNTSRCSDFLWTRPPLSEAQERFMKKQADLRQIAYPAGMEHVSDAATIRTKWTALVQRGGCPFDQKVRALEKAGFSTVIVYNYATTEDIPIRMSSHDLVCYF